MKNDTKMILVMTGLSILTVLLLKKDTGVSYYPETTYCTCPTCGYQVYHDRGLPCYNIKCPECGSRMVRI